MAHEFRVDDWREYQMAFKDPHRRIEPIEHEIDIADRALGDLVETGMIGGRGYDESRFLAMRTAVAERFDIPWTAISHRQQRIIYAINAIARPGVMVAAGVFCGNTYISNAGAAVGPGAVYDADDLVGLEIKGEEAERARRNVARLTDSPVARIIAAEAVAWVGAYDRPINLLYLDADGTNNRGKGVYLDILQAGYDRLPAGSLVLAHNSVNCAEQLSEYLAFVRDPKHMRDSVNIIVDDQGLEVSVK